MKIVKGDLLKLAKDGDFDVIVHGCNCFHAMGAGIAKQIKKAYPEAYWADKLTTIYGHRGKLGTCTVSDEPALTVINAYTQYHYSSKAKQVDYEAVRACFKWIAENYGDKRIGFPLIGAGLAGGDWKIISKIIDEELSGVEDYTLVEYQQ